MLAQDSESLVKPQLLSNLEHGLNFRFPALTEGLALLYFTSLSSCLFGLLGFFSIESVAYCVFIVSHTVWFCFCSDI